MKSDRRRPFVAEALLALEWRLLESAWQGLPAVSANEDEGNVPARQGGRNVVHRQTVEIAVQKRSVERRVAADECQGLLHRAGGADDLGASILEDA